ncbi:unnamed protein product [Miscanthus lutarioriparius]|uniref:PB1 domain-containing protein n=1 Tax=Miscanthus lutarioriparius TaxID=422564 RepID=A0A811MGW3_9POAL|nr:unnamed protein product [Miscanthus lutarioriparius]
MAPEPASRRCDDTHMKLLCSHGGRFLPCGPDGEPRYVGGETRVLVVPRAVSFRDLAARLAEMAGGGSAKEVRAISIRHRLADEGLEDVIVTVTCDEEVAHMRDEYDRLRATRPAARFRVFVTTATASSSAGPKRETTKAGIPPLAPPSSMRRVQSEQAVTVRAQHQHRPTRRVHSAQELAGGVHVQPSFHHHHHRHQHCCYCCSCQRRDRYTPAPPPARPTYALPYMSKKVAAAPPSVSAAEAAGRVTAVSTDAAAAREKATSRDVETAVQNRRAIWELE